MTVGGAVGHRPADKRTTPQRARLRARTRTSFVLWIALYTFIVILPLPLGLIQLDPGRGFWINFSVALGFVGLSMFGLQFLMGARSYTVAHPVGMDIVLKFHRQMAYLATLFVFAHPIILFVVDTRFLALLDVFTSPLRAKFAVASWLTLLSLIALSVFRRRLRIRYETWQLTHAILAVLVVVTALLHVLLVGYYVREPWEQALWIALSGAFIALGVWVRIVKPALRRRRRWVIDSIVEERGDATTITIRLLDPASYDPKGFHFEAGQFAWLMARRSPFSMSYHPFSISSSAARPERISFTIKKHEGFSREVADLVVGEHLYLEGPFGAFVLPPSGDLVCIAAGVGVTPVLSMLETIADQQPTRRAALWLGNRDETTITCHTQIGALEARMPLEVVHVLSRPNGDWMGETGRIDGDFIAGRLAAGVGGHDASYYICGPDVLMDNVERALVTAGVSRSRIHSERFGSV